MAEALVTLKLSPQEFRSILFALDTAIRDIEETISAASPSDLKGMRAEILRLKELRGKL